ncbi:MAG: PEP/pyruvate-binding domain-containing protein [Elusimicrobiota bacterium]
MTREAATLMKQAARLAVGAALACAGRAFAAPWKPMEPQEAAALIARMQANPRGPYERVMWHCRDGSILPPVSYGCAERGGGRQYGIPGADAKELAAAGIYVGTVLSSLTPADLTAEDYYRARAFIIEKFLESTLDGWALRSAKSYRGFRQAEDEEKAAQSLLAALARDDVWVRRHRYLAVRLARSMPAGADESLANDIRALATQLADKDPAFQGIRSKIHSIMEPGDASAVLSYAEAAPAVAPLARELAEKIRMYYDPRQWRGRLRRIKRSLSDKRIAGLIDDLVSGEVDVFARIRIIEDLLVAADRALGQPASRENGNRPHLIHLMSALEDILASTTAQLRGASMFRLQAVETAARLLRCAQALGIISQRELEAAGPVMTRMRTGAGGDYVAGYRQLLRTAEWSRALVLSELGIPIGRYALAEGRAAQTVDEVLRSGVMLPLAVIADRVGADIDSLRGRDHRLYGVKGGGLRGENQGLAIGPLRVREHSQALKGLKRNDVVLLYELPSELSPVAGIITVGAPGSLSHVALLVRNLGIPLVSVDGETADAIKAWAGREVVLGVSAGGRVVMGELGAFSEEDRRLLGRSSAKDQPFLRVPYKSLDLRFAEVLALSAISERDSGVRVGPKAAELARLKRLFPARVSGAAVLPFGLFVAHADRPGPGGAASPLARLRWAYAQAAAKSVEEREGFLLAELARFRKQIMELPFPDGFEIKIEAALARLGMPETFGVFVRSDTNVEDLREFTGAGLNLTVPNVTARSSILAAIRAVWASPFSERSYAWRQRVLLDPEHVYPSVILHKTVPAEISGVLVTMDMETGDPGQITVSASEGVAAVVDSGLPETIVVPKQGGAVRWLSSSRTSTKKAVAAPPQEGLVTLPAAGDEPLLGAERIEEILGVVSRLESIERPDPAVPWDVEFGFVKDRMFLMQLRPLKASRSAVRQPYLRRLDREGSAKIGMIDMNRPLTR